VTTRHRPIRLLLLTAAAIAALVLAGCSSDDDDGDNSTGEPPEDATTLTTPEDPEEEADEVDEELDEEDESFEEEGEGEEDDEEEGGGAEPEVIAAADVGELGEVLVDGEGFTVYTFANDEPGSAPSCTGGCAQAWTPVPGEGVTGAGAVQVDQIGSVERDDGTLQATYHGRPLYTFSGDTAPGDANGQGSGGVWFAIDVNGQDVTKGA
jgi:predicted lipoprotein with Yx(FWY)xxD motif